MGYRSKFFGLVRVDLDEEYFVEVAPLSKGEGDDAKIALLGGPVESTVKQGLEELKARLHQREYTDHLLVHGIKRWNLTDENDPPRTLLINLESIQGLRDEHSDKILAAIKGLTSPLDDKAAKLD